MSSLMNSRISCSSLSSIIRSLVGQKQNMIKGMITSISLLNRLKKASITIGTQTFKRCYFLFSDKKSFYCVKYYPKAHHLHTTHLFQGKLRWLPLHIIMYKQT